MNRHPARKVFMTTDAVGGVWTYCVDLADALAQRGMEVVLAVVGPDASPAQLGETSSATVINTGLPLDWLAESPAAISLTSKTLAALAREVKPDLVHLNTPAFAASGDFRVPVLGVCHSCVATWWAAVKAGPMPDDFIWRTAVQAEGLARCDGLLAPSHAFSEAVFRAYGQRPGVALNGRREFGAGSGEIGGFVFTAGRLWDEGKNLGVLNVAAALSDLDVRAAGPVEGPQGQALRATNIAMLGSLSPEGVRSQLARRPIFVSAAFYEPFGLAVLEAAQAGCPLVLADIPTFREFWSDAAVFVDPRDPAKIAGALKTLSADRQTAASLGAAARARALDYTVEAMTEATLSAYRALIRATTEVAA